MYCLIGFGLGVCGCVLVELWTHFCVYGFNHQDEDHTMYFFPEDIPDEGHDPNRSK